MDIRKLPILMIVLIMLSTAAHSETCELPDGSVVDNCLLVDDGNTPNVLVKWVHPIERTDDSPLSIDEIAFTKVYFHQIVDNHWTESELSNAYTAIFIYKPPGSYEIFGTTVDIQQQESVPSNRANVIVADLVESSFPPKGPIINVPNIGTIIININP